MAGDNEERDDVRDIAVTVEIGDEKEERAGRDLDDVLRWVLEDIRMRMGWSVIEMAKRLGISRGTMRQIFDANGSGTSLAMLSKICAALKMTPDSLFQSFPAYSPESRASVRFTEDVIYDRFRSLLTTDQARVALDVMDEAKRQGVLDEHLRIGQAQFPKRKPRREATKRKKA